MAIRTIKYDVTASGISPSALCQGGIQGEHNATQLEFTLGGGFVKTLIEAAASLGTAIQYRFDGFTGTGTKSSTAPCKLDISTTDEQTLVYPLENWLTREGGNIQVYLVITAIKDNTTEFELYSFPALIKLKNVPDGVDIDGGDYESLTTLAKSATEAAAEAKESATEAAGSVIESTEINEDGHLLIKYYGSEKNQDVGLVKGKDGKDGVSVTVSDIIENDEDGGSNEVVFSDGNTLSVKNGSKGAPFKYEDFTEEQLAALKGADGDSGVYVGSDTPPDSANVWVDPDEEAEPPAGTGEDGVSPTVEVTEIEGGHSVAVTDVNGTTTFEVMDGSNGKDGADGTSVTVVSVEDSNEDGGSNVVTFSDGSKLNVKNGTKGSTGEKGEKGDKGDTGAQGEKGEKGDTGSQGEQGVQGEAGATGADGYTPVKGTDYWTDEDKEEIIQELIVALGTPVFGRVDGENNIVLTGELVDGTYTIHYEDADGSLTKISTFEKSGNSESTTEAIEIDWNIGVKLDKSTGAESNDTMYSASSAYPIEDGSTYTITTQNKDGNSMAVCYWDSSGNYLGYQDLWTTVAMDATEYSIDIPTMDNAATFRLRIYHYIEDGVSSAEGQSAKISMIKTVVSN